MRGPRPRTTSPTSGQSAKDLANERWSPLEARLNKIMDDYLLPAGYEFQKVQHDFERLMQGKELFDRGVLAALDGSGNNNERHDVLTSIYEYVLPNYDDITAIYPELDVAVLRAVDAARLTEPQLVETPFGNLEERRQRMSRGSSVRILCDLRYINVVGNATSARSYPSGRGRR